MYPSLEEGKKLKKWYKIHKDFLVEKTINHDTLQDFFTH